MSCFLKVIYHTSKLAEDTSEIMTITDRSVNIGCRNLCVVTFKILKSPRQRRLEAGKSAINVLRYATAGIRQSIRRCIIKLNIVLFCIWRIGAGRHSKPLKVLIGYRSVVIKHALVSAFTAPRYDMH